MIFIIVCLRDVQKEAYREESQPQQRYLVNRGQQEQEESCCKKQPLEVDAWKRRGVAERGERAGKKEQPLWADWEIIWSWGEAKKGRKCAAVLLSLLRNLYIKRRMEEINAKKEQEVMDTTTSEILQMQKQYLSAAESKIT